MSRFFRAVQRRSLALFAVAFLFAAANTSALAVVPLDGGSGAPITPQRIEPEILVFAPDPTRPPAPLMTARLLPLPTIQPTPAPTPGPPPPVAATATASSSGGASTTGLDPAVDGTTRSNYPWGAGTASWYGPGSGVAMHYCSWSWRTTHGCGSVRITSTDTGRSVIAPVIDYCQCYWGTSRQRIVDLQTGLLEPLGLSSSAGLYSVVVEPVD